MATRSLIGIVLEDGTIRAIYCHWDGSPSNNGALLLKYYTDVEKIKSLIDLGDISELGEFVEPITETAVPRYNSSNKTNTPTTHSFDHPHEKVTIAYHRDRGEKLTRIINYTERGFYNQKNCGAQYYYLFKDDKWYVNGKELNQEIIELY